jgi:hypothetical protein
MGVENGNNRKLYKILSNVGTRYGNIPQKKIQYMLIQQNYI